jgi:hypothetical protein
VTSKELAPLPESVENLPEPREFARLLRERLEAEIIRVREERGEVHQAEDVYQLSRGLSRYIEIAGEYKRAFDGTAKIAKQELENELIDAVGEQDGTPTGGLTVPDLDGTDIKLALDQANSYDIDASVLRSALAARILESGAVQENVEQLAVSAAVHDDEEASGKLDNYLAEVITLALEEYEQLGAFSPQVSKVRAFAKDLAGRGADSLASLVSAAIRKTQTYRGVKVSREERK